MNLIRQNIETLNRKLEAAEPLLWLNPDYLAGGSELPLTLRDIEDADWRLQLFAPLLSQLFPELAADGGLIESPLLSVEALRKSAENDVVAAGKLWIKADHSLPVAGSVKARGGIYEVLCFAEQLAMEAGLLTVESDYRVLAEAEARSLFSRYQVAVGSTGNLGLSIGIIAARLGFSACVHMSRDAKEWKKKRLRDAGVEVVEHAGDYSEAVARGRAEADASDHCYFVDDENSERLFLGYAVAALRLQQQLLKEGIRPTAEAPLFVYIPCGVGGAPGGICFGLKQIFGDAVHCFFAEPVQAPSLLHAMRCGEARPVTELGLSVDTEADGLACGSASGLVSGLMKSLLAGVFTVRDDQLFRDLYRLHCSEGIDIEPSAAAGFGGPQRLAGCDTGSAFLESQGISSAEQCHHILWTTGGLFVPEPEQQRFTERGRKLCMQGI